MLLAQTIDLPLSWLIRGRICTHAASGRRGSNHGGCGHATERILRYNEIAVHQITQGEGPGDGAGEKSVHRHRDGLGESAEICGLAEFRIDLRKGESSHKSGGGGNDDGHDSTTGDRRRDGRRYPAWNQFGHRDTRQHAPSHLEEVFTARPPKDRGIAPIVTPTIAPPIGGTTPTPTIAPTMMGIGHDDGTPTIGTPTPRPPHIRNAPSTAPGIRNTTTPVGGTTPSTTSCHF